MVVEMVTLVRWWRDKVIAAYERKTSTVREPG
jgi:hypothetical protein